MSDLERRYTEIAGEDESPTVEVRFSESPKIRGLAAAYGKWSEDLGGFREIIEPGAFDKVLSKKKLDVVAFFDHEGQPLGRTTAGTLRLSANDKGLNYELDPPDTQLGRDVMTLIRRRDLYGSSFAFTVDQGKGDRWSTSDKGLVTRTITEFSGLYDVSVVTRPAYGNATSAALRSLEQWRQENLTAAEVAQAEERQADLAADQRRASIQRAIAAAHIARLKGYAQ